MINNQNSPDEYYFILYKVKSKNYFIDELGNDLLHIYVSSDSITDIYNKYTKNNVFDNLITNINSKIKQYHTANFNIRTEQKIKETIDKTVIKDILDVMSKSESESSLLLEDLSSDIDLDTLNTQIIDDIYIKPDSDDFVNLKESFVEIIENYYAYFIDYLTELKEPVFSNKTNDLIVFNIVKTIKTEFDINKIKAILQIIKLNLLIQTSLFIIDDDISNNTKMKNLHSYLDIFKSDKQNTKITSILTKIFNSKSLKLYIKNLDNPFLHQFISITNNFKNKYLSNSNSDSDSDSDSDSNSDSDSDSEKSVLSKDAIVESQKFNTFIDKYVKVNKKHNYDSMNTILKNIFFMNEKLVLNGYNIIQFTKILYNSDSDIFNIINKNEKLLLNKIESLSTDIPENLNDYYKNKLKTKKDKKKQ